jgi:hypothetical protein
MVGKRLVRAEDYGPHFGLPRRTCNFPDKMQGSGVSVTVEQSLIALY